MTANFFFVNNESQADRKSMITKPTMIQLQAIFQFSLSMQIHNTHIAWLMATFAYSNRCLDISLNAQFSCKHAWAKSITLFFELEKT